MIGPRRSVGCLWRLVDVYVVGNIVYLVLWRTTGDRFLIVYVLGFVAHLALPAAFVWLPVSLLLRRWPSLALQAVCLAAFVWLFGDVLRPRDPAPPPPGATTVTIMTYNLGNGLASAEQLVPLLRASEADVVAVQELTPEVAAALDAGLRDTYPHQALHGLGIPGKGVLSRFPIVDSELLPLNPDRPDLRAVLDVEGVEVTLLVSHPAPPRLAWSGLARRSGAGEHVSALLGLVEATDGPLLLVGDLNMTRMHALYDRLESAGLRDVYREAGDGLGFTEPARIQALAERDLPVADPSIRPFLRIDYVWASRDLQPVDARVADGAGSDHLPVVARVALVTPAG